MKIHRILAIAALPVISIGASAQSSVTLFGVVDANIRYVKNNDLPNNTTMGSGGHSSGRFGFRGVEDLGGGLKAGFWLESDLYVDQGTTHSSGKLFQRRSTVSLLGSFGELRLGRDLSPSTQNPIKYDPFNVIGLANSNRISRMPDWFSNYYRSDNAIQYITPNWNGFRAEVMYALDENPSNKLDRRISGRLRYDNGPLSLALTMGQTDVRGHTNTNPDMLYPAVITGKEPTVKFKQYGVGGSYDFGRVKLMGYFQREDLPYGAYIRGSGSEDRWQIGMTVPVGTHYIRASYVRTDSRGGDDAFNRSDANRYAVGYVHNLSRRTALYATVARITNKGGANFSLTGGTPGLAAGRSSTGAEFGMRHSF